MQIRVDVGAMLGEIGCAEAVGYSRMCNTEPNSCLVSDAIWPWLSSTSGPIVAFYGVEISALKITLVDFDRIVSEAMLD